MKPVRTDTSAAVYLRCYPFDPSGMGTHLHALRHLANELGFAPPAVFLDNGCRSRGPLPALQRLIGLLTAGAFRAVLVPGPFVFSLSDLEARSIWSQLTSSGNRVIELPASALIAQWGWGR
ncbi:hypothetical protein [Streptomyces sp. BE303]|uniref:hypothetical protein n=1 Tax=Streptomycetaceae TaxID=2062 RepID=UPI002E796CD8|nr:hypothetical protein [Streptomyces sp. BE303]MED7954656.1 hypothetical protein [Streptomyces sp. BE303]